MMSQRNLRLVGPVVGTALVALCLVATLATWVSPATAKHMPAMSKFSSLLPEKSAKEIRMNFKVLLTNMHVRQVPLAKKNSERLLAKLYREERVLKEQIAQLKTNLGTINDKQRRHSLRVLEVDSGEATSTAAGADSGASGPGTARRNLVKVHELSQARVDTWTNELKDKQLELDELRAKIDESKNIIRHPDSYIAIPSNYGRLEPEEVQDREREELLRDREIMDYRGKIESGDEVPPTFMTDHW